MFLRGALACLVMTACAVAQALTFSNAYSSPRTPERAVRKSTDYIILHTTEAEAGSSLRKLSQNGEAHYCVDRDGKVYRIVQRSRVAYHCGTSMWNGRKNIDDFSIGIEVVGYHNRALTARQYAALRELILLLQKLYGVKDANVMPHAQVAYGTPNRWHPKSHRGRKRCGMGYATPEIRKLIGLKERWLADPDVRARRLVVGDAYLARVLYAKQGAGLLPYTPPKSLATKSTSASAKKAKSTATTASAKPATVSSASANDNGGIIVRGRSAWDIARDAYNASSTLYIFPDGTRLTGDKIRDWESLVAGTRVILGDADSSGSPLQELTSGQHPRQVAGDAVRDADTWYFRPGGGRVQGSALTEKQLAALPAGTKILVGYAIGGPVTSRKLPSQICPTQWDAPETFYLMPGKPLKAFNDVDMRRVPAGTYIFYRN